MSAIPGHGSSGSSKGEKNSKKSFTTININSLYKGKGTETQKATGEILSIKSVTDGRTDQSTD